MPVLLVAKAKFQATRTRVSIDAPCGGRSVDAPTSVHTHETFQPTPPRKGRQGSQDHSHDRDPVFNPRPPRTRIPGGVVARDSETFNLRLARGDRIVPLAPRCFNPRLAQRATWALTWLLTHLPGFDPCPAQGRRHGRRVESDDLLVSIHGRARGATSSPAAAA